MINKRLLVWLCIPLMLSQQNCSKDTVDVLPPDHETWNYENPETWGAASGDCAGIIQSPIDIDTDSTLKVDMPDLEFHYSAFPIIIQDNGHTIQVSTGSYDAGNTIMFNNNAYKLKQFHFHSLSEHTINGEHAPMELHMVHANDEGEILVVGLMIEEGSAENTLVNTVWSNLPQEKKKEETKPATIDMDDVLPAGRDFYNYIGSLTTPPCTMGLQWIVMKEKLKLSAQQIETFRQKYHHNYRPVQKLNNRVVYEEI
jgi:carbonic anhydrase